MASITQISDRRICEFAFRLLLANQEEWASMFPPGSRPPEDWLESDNEVASMEGRIKTLCDFVTGGCSPIDRTYWADISTGGGCEAWCATFADGSYALITDPEGGEKPELNTVSPEVTQVALGFYDEDGEHQCAFDLPLGEALQLVASRVWPGPLITIEERVRVAVRD